jgi:hypothetical protein
VKLTVPAVPDRARAVRAAQRWFEVCPEPLHGRFGAAVRAGDTAGLGTVMAAVSIAIWDGVNPEPWDWQEEYTPESFAELLRRLGRRPHTADFWASTEDDQRRWNKPSFGVGFIAQEDYFDLSSTVDDAVEDRAILDPVREVAEMSAPLAVAVAFEGSPLDMPLEDAISRTNTRYVRRPAEVLRNYGWLTVLSDAMADRVGGAKRLRDSGAFAEVEPLSAGGWWLLATETWDEYGTEQAGRIFEVLAPVLPEGKPQLTRWIPDGTYHTLPNIVAERDPREVTDQS